MRPLLLVLTVLTALPAASAELKAIDVHTLNRRLPAMLDRDVRVAGEVVKTVDAGAIVIESGGLRNDEIVVLVVDTASGVDPSILRPDDDVVVTGVVRKLSRAALEEKLGWDLNPFHDPETGEVTVVLAEEIAFPAG